RAARYYFITAEKFDAVKAAQLGFIHQYVKLDELQTHGLQVAQQLLKNSPNAMKEAKKIIAKVSKAELSENLIKLTAEHLAMMRGTDDAQEGLTAFLEKRAPQY